MNEIKGSARFARPEEDDYEGRLKKRALQKRAAYIAITVSAIIVVLAIILWVNFHNLTGYKVIRTVDQQVDANSEYYPFGDNFLRINGDGITCYNNKGSIWNMSYEKQRYSRDICGSFVAVGEIGASTIHIANADDSIDGTVNTTYPIVKVEVANQGVTAALTEDSSANYIEVMDKDGNQLVTGRTVLAGNGYPVDFSLSADGTKMVVSYLYVSGGVSQSKLVFYNFSEVGKNEVDRMVGVFNNYDDMIVPMVEFISNDTAVAVADSCLTFYQMEEKPSEIARVEIEGEIDRIDTNEEYVAVLYGDEKQLVMYNKKGKQLFSESIDFSVDAIKVSGDRVLVLSGSECRLFSRSGKMIFHYQFDNGMTDMVPLKGNNFILLSNDGVEVIRLK